MANSTQQHSDLAYADTLWKSADALRGLTPGRYVGAEAQEEDDEPITEKYTKLLAELEECLTEGERLTAVVREKLGKVGDGA